MKIQSVALAGFIAALLLSPVSVSAEPAKSKTVAAVNQEKEALAGKTISVKGKIVKVNNGILGRNFLHVQDGTGDANTNDILVTSKQTAAKGDQVVISGVVVLNRDFGGGYKYPVLIEDASITPAK